MAREWADKPLSELCSYISRGSAPAYIEAGGVLVLNQKCVRDQRVVFLEARRTDQTRKPVIPDRMLQPLDILVNSTGVGTLGRVAQIVALPESATVDSHVTIVRPDPTAVDPRYLGFTIRLFAPEIEALAEGSTGQTELSRARLAAFMVPVAPENEQRAIAHILGALDDKIELNQRMNETLEAVARWLFKSWFVDFEPVRAKAKGSGLHLPLPLADLFPDSFEDSELGEIPKGWRVGHVGDHMVNFDSKRVPVSGEERVKRQGQYPYHGAAGVMDRVDDYLFDGIYLLVGEDGSVVEGNGMAVTQYVWGKLWVNNHAHVLQGKGEVSTEQLYLYFQFEPVAPYVTGAVQPKLSQGRMNTMPFVFAGEVACRGFAQTVQPMFAKLRANVDETKTLTALRDTLLPKLISGELRLQDAAAFLGESR